MKLGDTIIITRWNYCVKFLTQSNSIINLISVFSEAPCCVNVILSGFSGSRDMFPSYAVDPGILLSYGWNVYGYCMLFFCETFDSVIVYQSQNCRKCQVNYIVVNSLYLSFRQYILKLTARSCSWSLIRLLYVSQSAARRAPGAGWALRRTKRPACGSANNITAP